MQISLDFARHPRSAPGPRAGLHVAYDRLGLFGVLSAATFLDLPPPDKLGSSGASWSGGRRTRLTRDWPEVLIALRLGAGFILYQYHLRYIVVMGIVVNRVVNSLGRPQSGPGLTSRVPGGLDKDSRQRSEHGSRYGGLSALQQRLDLFQEA